MAGVHNPPPMYVVHTVVLKRKFVDAVLVKGGSCANCMFAGNPVDCSNAKCGGTNHWVTADDYTFAKLMSEKI